MDINKVATDFTSYYYNCFDTNRAQLAALYRDHSMLSFEDSNIQGGAAILDKLMNLPFQKVSHKVTTVNAQPANADGTGIIVMVTGQLLVEGSEHPMGFSQAFQLISDNGSYFVLNDIFRLIYG
ncbi:nuclear transport factor 2 [Syncephalis plumigaleata]|nr:nuclear transport factor 2 [Syncephalis plumigaleata]